MLIDLSSNCWTPAHLATCDGLLPKLREMVVASF
jgi:hypothetical protein